MTKEDYIGIVKNLAPSVLAKVTQKDSDNYKLRCKGVLACFSEFNNGFPKKRDVRKFATEYVVDAEKRLEDLANNFPLGVYVQSAYFNQVTPNFAFFDLVEILNEENIDEAIAFINNLDDFFINTLKNLLLGTKLMKARAGLMAIVKKQHMSLNC